MSPVKPEGLLFPMIAGENEHSEGECQLLNLGVEAAMNRVGSGGLMTFQVK